MSFDVQVFIDVAAYIGAGIAIGFGAIGAAIGEGYTAGLANEALSRNPDDSGDIVKNMLVGQAMAESAAIFALVVAIMLMFAGISGETLAKAAALIGAGICMGLGAVGSGIGAGYPGGLACISVARFPANSNQITTNMLIGSAVCQTPAIFAMVVSFLLMFVEFRSGGALWAALLGSGMCMGLGAIGSGVGSGKAAGACCEGIGRQPTITAKLTTNMLIGSAVCQTPAIFAMVVALLLMFMDFGHLPISPTWAALLGAGLSTGLASIGSGVGGGLTAEASCEGVSRNPESFNQVVVAMLMGQAVSQTPSIFGLLISFLLMFSTFPESTTLSASMALLGAGISMGFGGIGPGVGNGMTAQGAVRWIARNIEETGTLTRTMLVGQAVSQSTAIYAMVVSLVLIFVV